MLRREVYAMANIKETSGVMGYVDEQGNPSIHYPVTKAENVEGLDDAIKEQFTGGAISPNDIGAAASTHSHAASDIASGTFGVARGGTGQSSLTSGSFLKGNGTSAVTLRTAAQTLYDIINGSTALASSGAADSDYIGLDDVSASTGKKMLLSELAAYIKGKLSAATQSAAGLLSATDKTKLDGIATGATKNTVYVYTFTAANWSSGTLTIAAATHGITGSGIVATFYHNLSGTYTAGTWACIESWAYIDPSTHVITLHGPTDGYAGKVVLIG